MKVRISYSPNSYLIGTVQDLPDDEAKLLIREGRAQAFYPGEDPGEGGVAPVQTVVPASQSSPGRQAEGSEQAASTSMPAKATGTKRVTTTDPA